MPTSGKVRTKVASVLDYAKASGWCAGDNPAAAKTMGKIIPAVAKPKHHDAMDWRAIPAFMRDLTAFDTPASRALRFTILCAARVGETRFATWGEITGDVWSRPAEHMKEGIAHSVPLTSAALALLGPPRRTRRADLQVVANRRYGEAARHRPRGGRRSPRWCHARLR
jgi:integrase